MKLGDTFEHGLGTEAEINARIEKERAGGATVEVEEIKIGVEPDTELDAEKLKAKSLKFAEDFVGSIPDGIEATPAEKELLKMTARSGFLAGAMYGKATTEFVIKRGMARAMIETLIDNIGEKAKECGCDNCKAKRAAGDASATKH